MNYKYLAAALASLALFGCNLGYTISPIDKTKTLFTSLEVRFKLALREGNVVTDMKQLPKRKGYNDGDLTDGWHHEIEMKVTALDGKKYKLEFRSAGPDGKFKTADDLTADETVEAATP